LQRTAVGIDVDGGFAELARVPARCAWPIPAGLGDEDALLAEPLAVVVRAVDRAAPRAGETARRGSGAPEVTTRGGWCDGWVAIETLADLALACEKRRE
jgi:NADPH:quinone reductase-like Zn-dependent oxidoreductase